MGDVLIRPAVPGDIPTVLLLLRELAEYERKADRVRIDERLLRTYAFGERPCIEVLLGLLDGRAVCYALFFPHFRSFGGLPWLYLEDLYVQPDARGTGVGRAMMAHLAKLALGRGWAGMSWSVLDWNRPAFAFYRALGAAEGSGNVPMDLAGEALEQLAGEG